MTIAFRLFPFLGFAGLVLGVWWSLTATGSVHPFLLPPPDDVWRAFGVVARDRITYEELLTTLTEIGAAFGIAAVCGLAVGIPVGWYRPLRNAYEPLLANLYAIPIIVIYPLLALLLGLGSASKIAFAAIYAFFPIAIATIAGSGTVDQTLVTAARAMGARRLSLLRTVVLPWSLPQIVNGLQLGLVLTTLAVVGGEFIAGAKGLGYLLATAGQAYRTEEMYAFILVTLLLAIVLNGLMALLALVAKRRLHA